MGKTRQKWLLNIKIYYHYLKKNKNNGRSFFDILGDFGFFSHKKNNRTLIKVATWFKLIFWDIRDQIEHLCEEIGLL